MFFQWKKSIRLEFEFRNKNGMNSPLKGNQSDPSVIAGFLTPIFPGNDVIADHKGAFSRKLPVAEVGLLQFYYLFRGGW